MEARIKATGEIVEVKVYKREHRLYIRTHGEKTGEIYRAKDLDFNIEDGNTSDYWTRLEHQYAGMVIGGMCGNKKYNDYAWDDMAKFAITAAHTLIQKLKEKEERK